MTDEVPARLAALLGIDQLHLRDRRNPRDPATHGIAALVGQTRIVNPFDPGADGSLVNRVELGRLVTAHYGRGPKAWDARLADTTKRFFTGRPGRFYSPLDGALLPAVGELFGSRLRWLQWVVLQHAPLRILILEANSPICIWYPERQTLLALRESTSTFALAFRQLLHLVLEQPAAFLAWLDAAGRPAARRAFIIGEARPSHFMAQTLGFVERHLEDLILPFLKAGHLLTVLSDRSFVDPLRVFPELRNYPVLAVPLEQAPAILCSLGLHCRLNDRRITNTSFGWVSRLRAADTVQEGRPVLGVLVSVDAERMRFDNQIPAFAACLERLGREAASLGASLTVYWDGWTVAAGNVPGPRDHAVCGRIASIASAIREACPARFEEVVLYGRSIEDKIGLATDCRIALATYGTATILPTCALAVPTITYHIESVVNDAVIRSARYLDPAHAVAVPASAVTAVAPMEEQPHRQRFHVEIPALLAVLEEVLSRGPILPPEPG